MLLVAGYWLLVTGFWLLVIGFVSHFIFYVLCLDTFLSFEILIIPSFPNCLSLTFVVEIEFIIF